VLRLAILIRARLRLLASVALHAALEVVVLAIAADPATIWEVKGFAIQRFRVGRVASMALLASDLLGLSLLLLVFAPLRASGVVLFLSRSAAGDLRLRLSLQGSFSWRRRARKLERRNEALRASLKSHNLIVQEG